MSEPEKPAPAPEAASRPFALVRRVDDFVFAVEQAVVATALITMATVVFLDVLHLRLTAPDSKMAGWIASIAGITDEAALVDLNATTGPWVAAGLMFVVLWLGALSAEHFRGKRFLAFSGSALAVATGVAAVMAGAGWVFVAIEPRDFLVVLFVVMAGGFVALMVRERAAGWMVRVASLVVLAPGVWWFTRTYVPVGYGYGWAQELALLLLLWVGFFGMSICAYAGKHMRLEAFEKLLPPSIARYVSALGFLLAAAFCGYLGWSGYGYMATAQEGAVFGQMMETPEWLGMGVVPLAFGIATLRFLAGGVSAALGGGYGRPAVDDSLKEAEDLAKGRVPAAATDAAAPKAEGGAS